MSTIAVFILFIIIANLLDKKKPTAKRIPSKGKAKTPKQKQLAKKSKVDQAHKDKPKIKRKDSENEYLDDASAQVEVPNAMEELVVVEVNNTEIQKGIEAVIENKSELARAMVLAEVLGKPKARKMLYRRRI